MEEAGEAGEAMEGVDTEGEVMEEEEATEEVDMRINVSDKRKIIPDLTETLFQ